MSTCHVSKILFLIAFCEIFGFFRAIDFSPEAQRDPIDRIGFFSRLKISCNSVEQIDCEIATKIACVGLHCRRQITNMIRTNTTTCSKNKKKLLSGGGKTTMPRTKTFLASSSIPSDTTKKPPSKSGGQTIKTGRMQSMNATSAKADTNLVHQSSTNLDPLLGPKKLKRSNSFFLTRKLTKIYHTLTGSKDNLNKIPENDDHHGTQVNPMPNPFKFTRSASLATIPLRRSYRNSNIRESKLEQLREEDGHGHGNGSATPTDTESTVEKGPIANGVMNGIDASDNDKMSTSERKNSFSLMSSLRRTFSVTPAKRKSSYNTKWSASLMNLQQIDVMISYEDLSFINYDKFNTYEANLIRHLSQTDVNTKLSNRNSVPDERTIFNNSARRSVTSESLKSIGRTDDQSAADQYFINYPEVKRRNKQRRVNVYAEANRMSDVRRSYVENRSPHHLNRQTFRWSTPCESLNTQQFTKSNVSLRIENTVDERIDGTSCVSTTNPTISATAPNESPINRCISCNSLRRTQSMNEMTDVKRGQSFVSIIFYYFL